MLPAAPVGEAPVPGEEGGSRHGRASQEQEAPGADPKGLCAYSGHGLSPGPARAPQAKWPLRKAFQSYKSNKTLKMAAQAQHGQQVCPVASEQQWYLTMTDKTKEELEEEGPPTRAAYGRCDSPDPVGGCRHMLAQCMHKRCTNGAQTVHAQTPPIDRSLKGASLTRPSAVSTSRTTTPPSRGRRTRTALAPSGCASPAACQPCCNHLHLGLSPYGCAPCQADSVACSMHMISTSQAAPIWPPGTSTLHPPSLL